MKIIVAGGSGFLGTALRDHFHKQGHDVLPLVRTPKARGIFWRPESGLLDSALLEGADVVINLCGESVMGRWSDAKIQRLYASRLVPAQFLADALAKLEKPPQVVVAASAVGYYGDRGAEALDEQSGPGTGHLAEICLAWEKCWSRLGVRVVHGRFGMILGSGGGALPKMALPFRFGLGGRMGSGEQFVSWMALCDLLAAFDHVISHPSLVGPVNFTSPNPLTNGEMTRILGMVLKRPTLFPVPEPLLRLLFREGADIFLASTRALPQKLCASGFQFSLPQIEETFKKYLL